MASGIAALEGSSATQRGDVIGGAAQPVCDGSTGGQEQNSNSESSGCEEKSELELAGIEMHREILPMKAQLRGASS
jgi:hypothetical protein